MIRDILQSINGIEIFPVVALMLFFIVFTAIIVWTVLLDKEHINKMKQLPLESTHPGEHEKHIDL